MPELVSDLYNESGSQRKPSDDVGCFESALAGVATGLWNIPKGVFSFGAEMYDLIGDTNTAKEVEEWFDDVNPFDDEAEARTVGKVFQAITQVAPLAVSGFALGARAGVTAARGLGKRAAVQQLRKLGVKEGQQFSREIARRAIAAKRAGKSFSIANKGRKRMGKTTGGDIGGGSGEVIVADEDSGRVDDIERGD